MSHAKPVPYVHVDAFTATPLKGNQAAVMLLDSWPDDALLQAIGAENLFAETAFLVPDASGAAAYELRWFTPELEVRLCGHATLASGHVLLQRDAGLDRVTFRTRKAGVLEVRRDGANGYAVGLPAIPTQPGAWDAVIPLLGTATPGEVWQSPDRYNILLYADAAEVAALAPDMKALKALGDHQFICTAPGAGHPGGADVVSRVFVPGGGVDEDAATGSAHAALTPFWTARLGRDRFTAHQASARGADFTCRLDGDRAWLGGHCVTVVEGTFLMPG
ncbi:PhzF family phenazine biosynthesis protein [Novosphingobium lentum]|uniref:PhzF family phenazine biosynthesis protein n=1 Tax=Novosphingobium lentum TaxID=145287 RepID=UPI00082E9FC0|nr:PhzF family phenazine biosynthesis protein [Novosphingobium lentum]